MTYGDHPLIPPGSDAQIEKLTYPTSTAEASPEERLEEDLAVLYGADPSLEHSLERAWKRLEHQLAATPEERQELSKPLGRNTDHLQALPNRMQRKRKPGDFPEARSASPAHPRPTAPARPIRWFAQAIAAVFLVGVLLAGVAALVVTHHPSAKAPVIASPSKQATGISIQPSAIVVAISQEGTVYGVRPDNGKVLWRVAVQKQITQTSDLNVNYVLVQGQVAYVANNDRISALRASDGHVLWQKNLGVPGVNYSFDRMIFENGRLYVGARSTISTSAFGEGIISALQASDGSVLWHAASGAIGNSPLLAVNNGVVYEIQNALGPQSYTLRALEGESGHVLWTATALGEPLEAVGTTDTLYVYMTNPNGFQKGEKALAALDTANGHQRWLQPIIDQDYNSLLAFQGTLIMNTQTNQGNRFCAYRSSDGTQVWCSAPDTTPLARLPSYTIMNNTLYAATAQTEGQQVEALSVVDGRSLWTIPLRSGLTLGSFKLKGRDGTLYLMNFSSITALSASDGHTLWSFETDHNVILEDLAFGSW